MSRLWRWIRYEPWMALNAGVATACGITVVAIRWLAVVGIVRDFAVSRTAESAPGSNGGFSVTSSSFHRQLGLASGPSHALTHLDHVAWIIGLVTGIFWILRLGWRAADRRIGSLRTLGLLVGFAPFVATGVMHSVADALPARRSTRNRLDYATRLWCALAVCDAILLSFSLTAGVNITGAPTLGQQAVLTPVAWSIARAAVQLAVALGGWSILTVLTYRWVRSVTEPADRSGVEARA